jgi:hypothetical protein
MPESTYRWGAFLATLSTLAVLGCAGKDRLFKLEGVVTLDGQPVQGAIVSFLPDEKGGRFAVGTTAQDGSFRLTTYRKDDGALPGDYRVTVTLIPDDDEEDNDKAKDNDKGKEDPPTGEKTADGKALMSAMVKMAAARQKALERSPIPAIYRDGGRTPLRQTVPAQGKVILALKREQPKTAKNGETEKSAEQAPSALQPPAKP